MRMNLAGDRPLKDKARRIAAEYRKAVASETLTLSDPMSSIWSGIQKGRLATAIRCSRAAIDYATAHRLRQTTACGSPQQHGRSAR